VARFALISGVPRAGKSSLSDAIVARHPGFTHVPLDRYVIPVPASQSFLEWIATPACIAWDRLLAHIAILELGSHCYTPHPDWKDGRGEWTSDGGAIAHGPGRRMEPARVGYLVPGTHAFAFPASVGPAIRIFVDTPEDVIAQRLSGGRERGERAKATIRKWLGANPQLIAAQAPLADFVIDGTVGREEQLARFMKKAGAFFGLAPPG
jgi:hypothetical protein